MKKKRKELPAEFLAEAWDLMPYVLIEVLARANKGNRTARSILRTAQINQEMSRVDAFLKRIL